MRTSSVQASARESATTFNVTRLPTTQDGSGLNHEPPTPKEPRPSVKHLLTLIRQASPETRQRVGQAVGHAGDGALALGMRHGLRLRRAVAPAHARQNGVTVLAWLSVISIADRVVATGATRPDRNDQKECRLCTNPWRFRTFY